MTQTMTDIEDNGKTMTPVCHVVGCGWSGTEVSIQESRSHAEAFDAAWDDLIAHLMIDHPWLVSV